MSLTLSMLRCPDTVAPQTRTVTGGEFSIGRGPENDWVLPDPERYLSKRHCVLAFRAGGWQIADLSTNGTFLNRDSEPIGRGAAARRCATATGCGFGPYEIEVRIAETAAPAAPARRGPTRRARSVRGGGAETVRAGPAVAAEAGARPVCRRPRPALDQPAGRLRSARAGTGRDAVCRPDPARPFAASRRRVRDAGSRARAAG